MTNVKTKKNTTTKFEDRKCCSLRYIRLYN